MGALNDAGMDVTGVEGRAENIAQTPELLRPRVIHADVRDLVRLVSGPFDVTLCLGILYHLGVDDALRLLRDIRAVTDGVLILDTHVSLVPTSTAVAGGFTYYGGHYSEGDDLSPPWSAIGNHISWWFGVSSLRDALTKAGFEDIQVLPGPVYADEPTDRYWFTARTRSGS